MDIRGLFAFRPKPNAPLPELVEAYFKAPLPPKNTPVEGLRIVALDTETTGLESRQGDKLLSIGAVGVRNLRVELGDRFYSAVNAGICSKESAVKVHFITPSETARAPRIEEVLPKFLEYIGGDVLVAHHAAFDRTFLNMEMKRLYGAALKNTFLDTASLALFLKRQEKSSYGAAEETRESKAYSLDMLLKEFHLPPIAERHHALSDAFATAQLTTALVKKLKQIGVRTLGDLGLTSIH